MPEFLCLCGLNMTGAEDYDFLANTQALKPLRLLKPVQQNNAHVNWELIVAIVWSEKSLSCIMRKHLTNEPRREKTGLRDFRPGLTQTDLYSHRSGLEA